MKTVEPSLLRTSIYRFFCELHQSLTWEVPYTEKEHKAHLAGEYIPRDVLTPMIRDGLDRIGGLYLIAVARKANFLGIGHVAWFMLSAPSIRFSLGVIQVWHPVIDTVLKSDIFTYKDRYGYRINYDLNTDMHADVSHVFYASAMWKFCSAYHGEMTRGNEMTIRMGLSDENYINSSQLQSAFYCPVTTVKGFKGVEFSFSEEFVNKKGLHINLEDWERSKEAMRQPLEGESVAHRYALLLNTHCKNWNYNRGKPKLGPIVAEMSISDRTLRNYLAEINTTPKEIMAAVEARRIYLTMRMGHSLTETAKLYRWSNTRDMIHMVKNAIDVDLKKVKPYSYLESKQYV